MLTEIFTSVLNLSVVGGIFSVVLLCISPIMRRFFTPGARYYLWLSVLVVMAVPLRINMPQRAPQPFPQTAAVEMVDEPSYSNTQDGITLRTADNLYELSKKIPPDGLTIISAIWLLGVLCKLISMLIKYAIFRRALQKSSRAETANFEIPSRLRVRKCGLLHTPLIIGIFKPILYLPDTDLPADNLRYIFMHELTHYNRRDILCKWFSAAVTCVHWFNPLVYVILRQIDAECEISCDALVAGRLASSEQKNYMHMILDMLDSSSILRSSLTSQMSGGKKLLKRRIIMFKNRKPHKKSTVIISIFVSVLLISCAVLASGIIGGGTNTAPTDGNILIVGKDSGGRADSITIAGINNDRAALLFIPRGTVFSDSRVSTIYAQNGIDALKSSIEQNLEIPIDYYAEIDIPTAENIIDSLGGVFAEIPIPMNYSDPHQDLQIQISAGKQQLDGKGLLNSARYRSGYEKGDISRLEFQQKLVDDVFSYLKENGAKNKLASAAKIFAAVSTNLPADAVKNIDKINTINTFILPGNLDEKTADYIPDITEMQSVINDSF